MIGKSLFRMFSRYIFWKMDNTEFDVFGVYEYIYKYVLILLGIYIMINFYARMREQTKSIYELAKTIDRNNNEVSKTNSQVKDLKKKVSVLTSNVNEMILGYADIFETTTFEDMENRIIDNINIKMSTVSKELNELREQLIETEEIQLEEVQPPEMPRHTYNLRPRTHTQQTIESVSIDDDDDEDWEP